MSGHPINLGFRFLLEVAALASAGYWGGHIFPDLFDLCWQELCQYSWPSYGQRSQFLMIRIAPEMPLLQFLGRLGLCWS